MHQCSALSAYRGLDRACSATSSSRTNVACPLFRRFISVVGIPGPCCADMAATTGVLRCAVRARFVGRCVHGIRLPQHYPFSSSRGLWVNRVIFLPEDHCGDRSGQPLDTALLPLVLPLADRRAVHILEVLKKGPGDAVRGAVLGSGILCDYKIQELTAKAVVLEPVPATRSPAVETREVAIDLILAAPRPSRVKLLLPQIAALGVSRLVFLKAERVVRGYMQTGVLRPDKAHQLQKLLQV